MREDLKRAGARWVRTLAYGLILFVILFSPLLIPGEMFIKVERLEFIPAGGRLPGGEIARRDTVLQERNPTWEMRLDWAARVQRAVPLGNGETEAADILMVSECSGDGSWTYKPKRHPAIMALTEWSGDRSCNLLDGTYRLYGQWTLDWFLWSWTVDEKSAFFTIEGRGESF